VGGRLILKIINADYADAPPMTADGFMQFHDIHSLSAAIGVASAFIGVMN
jgi:hypothetical protein